MINEVTPAVKVGDEEKASETITELSEDMEMVSPGAMLREARKVLSFSQDHIANKLNLKVTLIQNIENDTFDPSMPVTFNRGYLSNYAKLVDVDIEDVLASYDALDAASVQRSEMLSFSKETSKQAEHSRVMWLSYLIVAVLVGLTILWWQQEGTQQDAIVSIDPVNTPNQVEQSKPSIDETLSDTEQSTTDNALELLDNKQVPDLNGDIEGEDVTAENPTSLTLTDINTASVLDTSEEAPAPEVVMSTAIFTFKGDCWVNIHDATGERIAWGVKKSGYVMTIQGQAPLSITVGKPELTSIVFNDQAVDMSQFNVGNIAKFNLPTTVE
jgi:cytoskeleton protein RodZ